MKNRPDCILKPGMVHAKMYSTIHKSALSQQINKTFFFSLPELEKHPPLLSPQRRGNVMVRGSTEPRRTGWPSAAREQERGAGEVSGPQRVAVGRERHSHG